MNWIMPLVGLMLMKTVRSPLDLSLRAIIQLVDGDMDGFSEIEQAFTVGVDTPTNITLSDPLPPTWDIQFTLIQDGEAVTLESNDTIEFEQPHLKASFQLRLTMILRLASIMSSYHPVYGL